MSAILIVYIVLIVIGIIGMLIRAIAAREHSPERLRTIIVLPAMTIIFGMFYAHLLADKAFAGFVALLQFGFISDLLLYFVGLNILFAVLSAPAIPWLLSADTVRARVWGGICCLCVALWLPFCQVLTSAPPH